MLAQGENLHAVKSIVIASRTTNKESRKFVFTAHS